MHDEELERYTSEAAEHLCEPILRILQEYPEGIREYDLLRELEVREGELFGGAFEDRELSLFRSHFFLFHILYRLRERLLQERRYLLEIFCLEIRLHPWETAEREEPQDELSRHDGVRDYYLDLENLYTTDAEDVRRMLRDFTRRLRSYYNREGALQELGLGPDASFPEVKRRYRHLVLRHHPDRGGDPERFRRVREAMEQLAALPW
jgi:DnaJ-domain-containing protein 1